MSSNVSLPTSVLGMLPHLPQAAWRKLPTWPWWKSSPEKTYNLSRIKKGSWHLSKEYSSINVVRSKWFAIALQKYKGSKVTWEDGPAR